MLCKRQRGTTSGRNDTRLAIARGEGARRHIPALPGKCRDFFEQKAMMQRLQKTFRIPTLSTFFLRPVPLNRAVFDHLPFVTEQLHEQPPGRTTFVIALQQHSPFCFSKESWEFHSKRVRVATPLVLPLA